MVIFDFSIESNIQNWRIVDDGVMGGLSSGNFVLNPDGHGTFYGNVSLENNGGFSSLRYHLKEKDISKYSKVILHVKGDGKNYQFRIKSKLSDYHSYVVSFKTTGDWEEIEFELSDFYPRFRGNALNMPNFPGDTIEEIAFLIGNKKAEDFEFMIDKIVLTD